MLDTIKNIFNFGDNKPSLYLIKNGGGDRTDFPTYGQIVPKHQQHAYVWFSGKPIQVDIEEPITYQADKDFPLEDFLYTNTTQFVISRKLYCIVNKFTRFAKPYRARITFESKELSTDYISVNFESAVSCLSSKSKIEYAPDRIRISRVKKLVVDECKIPEEEGIFRLEEDPLLLLCSLEFRDAVLRAGCTGIEFIDFRRKYLV